MSYCIAGYPGSGNRVIYGFLKSIAPQLFSEVGTCPEEKPLTNQLHETFQLKYNIECGKKVFHIIRNPLDAIYSRIRHNHGHDVPVEDFYNIDKRLEKHKRFAYAWNIFVEAGIKNRGNPNYMEIKYEDFCLKQEKTLKKICKFLEIEFKQKYVDMLNQLAVISMNKHKNLKKEQIDDIKNITKLNMEKCRYELD